jgi:predicted RNase H-like nuclease (RuvC/YqgF family)
LLSASRSKGQKLQSELDKLCSELKAADTAKEELQAKLETSSQRLSDVQRSAEAGRSYKCRAEAAEQQLADSSRALCTLQQELQTVRSALQVPSSFTESQ